MATGVCGLITTVNRERKNSVALGFSPLVMKPVAKALARRPCATLSRTTMAKSGPGLATASRWIRATVRNSLQYMAAPHRQGRSGRLANLLLRPTCEKVQLMSNSARAVFLDHASLDLGDLDMHPLHQAFAELTLHAQTRPDQVAERLQGAQVAISNKVPLDATT